MRNILKKLVIGLMSIGVLIILSDSMTVSASQKSFLESEKLLVTGYEVTNETITPGSDFTLTVKLHNFSTEITAKKVVVVINNPEGVIPDYGTVSQAYLEEIRPGESVEVSFQYNSDTTIEDTSLNFTVNISSANFNGSSQIRVPVGRMVDFDTTDVFIPDKLVVNKTEYLSVMVESLGNKGVSNVVMVARCDGKEIASSNIGTIAAGTTKTQSISVVFPEVGQHVLEIVLTYTNSDAENKEYLVTTTVVNIRDEDQLGKISDDTATSTNQGSQVSKMRSSISSNNIVLICICGILLIAVCCVILLLLYKRK